MAKAGTGKNNPKNLQGIRPHIYCLSLSARRGGRKRNVAVAEVADNAGIIGDAHCYSSRPLSLLPFESFAKVQRLGLKVKPGDFAENITVRGLDFSALRVGTRLKLGDTVEIEVVEIGKECHNGCRIKKIAGDCIMPKEGVFARAIKGGRIRQNDTILILGQIK